MIVIIVPVFPVIGENDVIVGGGQDCVGLGVLFKLFTVVAVVVVVIVVDVVNGFNLTSLADLVANFKLSTNWLKSALCLSK